MICPPTCTVLRIILKKMGAYCVVSSFRHRETIRSSLQKANWTLLINTLHIYKYKSLLTNSNFTACRYFPYSRITACFHGKGPRVAWSDWKCGLELISQDRTQLSCVRSIFVFLKARLRRQALRTDRRSLNCILLKISSRVVNVQPLARWV